MDTPAEAIDYDSMDHSDVNRIFVDDLLEAAQTAGFDDLLESGEPLKVLDVGTGTAQIPIQLCCRPVNCDIWAIDLAAEMLLLAAENVRNAALDGRILLEREDAKALNYSDVEFDWVISNSIVHHIPDPELSMREMLRVLRPGGLLFVRDLLRPASDTEVESIVRTYAGLDNERQQQLFRQSLHAALRVEEVRELLMSQGWSGETVFRNSDRHWTIAGAKPE
jgi:ubiquinone/menaquinone biosynthesis C-methylase UbiE